ncbi:MAG: hypothetical protein KDE27_18295 [Planctomycetes bacterium]|nr:hypothetical protein [Planctomycetota bacterium]
MSDHRRCRRYAAIPSFVAVALTGCGSAPTVEIPFGELATLHDVGLVEIPAALQVDTDERPGAEVQIGDCAVYSLSIDEPNGQRSWLVRATIAQCAAKTTGAATITHPDYPPLRLPLTGFVRYHVQVSEPDGTTLSEAFTDRVPLEVLRAGFAGICEYFADHPELSRDEMNRLLRELPAAEQRPLMLSNLATTAMLALVLEAEPLAPLLEAAVRRPSLLTVAMNLAQGIQVSFDADRAHRWHQPTAFPEANAYVYPLSVTAFSELALQGTMVVTDAAAALPVTVGVSSLAATHPENPDVRVRLRLQAVGRLQPLEWGRVMLAMHDQD